MDGSRLAILFCSPFDLDELAVGYALARGLVTHPGDLKALAVRPDQRSVSLTTLSGSGAGHADEGWIFSACGAASLREAQAVSDKPVLEWAREARDFSLEDLNALSRRMFGAAELYRKTGGMHIAALAAKPASAKEYFVAREDVGRHNAVDKVLGRGFLDRIEFRRAVLITSGRIAADMVLKAGAAGIPLIASRSIPTTEAYRLALDRRIVLVGRIGSAQPLVYSGGSP